LRGLARAEDVARQLTHAASQERHDILFGYHRQRLEALEADWRRDLALVGASGGPPADVQQPRFSAPSQRRVTQQSAAASPRAAVANRIAAPKAAVEAPLVAAATPLDPALSADEVSAELWQRIAALHLADAQLDQRALAVVRAKHPTAVTAAKTAVTKSIVESPLLRLVRSLQNSIALDTVKNEYQLHRKLHQWFVERRAADDLAQLNEAVYSELFLTPSSDPWLGLMPSDSFAALEEGGVER
jgi:hypothetical protein